MSDKKDEILNAALLSRADKNNNNEEILFPHVLGNILNELKKEGMIKETWYMKLRKRFCGKNTNNYCPIGLAFATVFMLVIGVKMACFIICPPIPAIDELYKDVRSAPNFSAKIIQNSSPSNNSIKNNILSFSETSRPYPAIQAFTAGVWKGRQDLLSLSSPTTISWLKKDWATTEWKSYFELGRWTFLLESVCLNSVELPEEFWEKQKTIAIQVTKTISARQTEKNEIENVAIDWVLLQFEEEIMPLLEQLPDDKKQVKMELAEKLLFFRDGLMVN